MDYGLNVILIIQMQIQNIKWNIFIHKKILFIGKGSVKLTPSSGNAPHKPVIHVSLSLREEVKLNEVDSAWKPTRFRKDTMNEEEQKTQVINILPLTYTTLIIY